MSDLPTDDVPEPAPGNAQRVRDWRYWVGGGLIVLANLAPELLKSREPVAPATAA